MFQGPIKNWPAAALLNSRVSLTVGQTAITVPKPSNRFRIRAPSFAASCHAKLYDAFSEPGREGPLRQPSQTVYPTLQILQTRIYNPTCLAIVPTPDYRLSITQTVCHTGSPSHHLPPSSQIAQATYFSKANAIAASDTRP